MHVHSALGRLIYVYFGILIQCLDYEVIKEYDDLRRTKKSKEGQDSDEQ